MRKFLQLMAAANNYPQWMVEANETYGIPLQNLKDAYAIDSKIKMSFDGTGRWLQNINGSYFDTGVVYEDTQFEIECKFQILNTEGWAGSFGDYDGEDKNVIRCIQYNGQKSLYIGIYTKANNGTTVCVKDKTSIHSVNMSYKNNKRSLILDGSEISLTAVGTGNKNTKTLSLMTGNPKASYAHNTKMAYFYSNVNGTSYFYCPILKDGEATMIDLMTMSYPTKVGTFKIE